MRMNWTRRMRSHLFATFACTSSKRQITISPARSGIGCVYRHMMSSRLGRIDCVEVDGVRWLHHSGRNRCEPGTATKVPTSTGQSTRATRPWNRGSTPAAASCTEVNGLTSQWGASSVRHSSRSTPPTTVGLITPQLSIELQRRCSPP
eukprot:Amastigsp_a339197_494.p3 type:complete len:148 gc:universal Amastigsp_a339197_494:343-786(+)